MSIGISRRSFLSGSAASAMLLSNPLFALQFASVNDADGLALLVAENSLDQAIQKSLLAHKDIRLSVANQTGSIADISALRNWLKTNAGKKILGAVGNDLYPTLESLVRELRGSVLFHGRHVLGEEGESRHQFYTVPASQGAARQFAGSLGLYMDRCQVSELCFAADEAVSGNAWSIAEASDWSAATTNILISIANGDWQPGPVAQYKHTHEKADFRAIDSVETFVFQL